MNFGAKSRYWDFAPSFFSISHQFAFNAKATSFCYDFGVEK